MKLLYSLFVGFLFFVFANSAHSIVMDYGSGVAATITTGMTYSQNGLTMTPLDDGSGGENHWDWYRDSGGANNTDWHAAIHSGNNGGDVRFDFGGTAFDLSSIFVEGILTGAGGVTALDALFTSSNGSTHTVSNPTSGIIDFSVLAGFSNISFFTIDIVNPSFEGNCADAGAICTTFMFDNVTFDRHVPSSNVSAPATLALMSLGLLGLSFRKRKVV